MGRVLEFGGHEQWTPGLGDEAARLPVRPLADPPLTREVVLATLRGSPTDRARAHLVALARGPEPPAGVEGRAAGNGTSSGGRVAIAASPDPAPRYRLGRHEPLALPVSV